MSFDNCAEKILREQVIKPTRKQIIKQRSKQKNSYGKIRDPTIWVFNRY